ncbi:uncharacterized protein LOC111338662 [Stylophora pistillata]|uniref:uncharacterized protein LOC111338662 n=1 Tax=Stylophora pistillata TaxID=50429 RepID=UPI000C04DE40|nr:uncharacterized protein LOC111338662 [Stylophora pistillata]
MQIMTIAAMEPNQPGDGESLSPDYSQIYTLLSRVMRDQPPPNLTPLDAQVILDLMADLDRGLAGHDISSQVSFITNKYKEVMQSQDTASSSGQTQVSSGQAEPACSTSDPKASSSGKPKTPLSSLNPLNIPVSLLNLKKSTPVSTSQS